MARDRRAGTAIGPLYVRRQTDDNRDSSWDSWRNRLIHLPNALDARRARAYAVALLLMTFIPYALLVGQALSRGTFPLFTDGGPIGGDLASHLLGGRLALHGDLSDLYDLDHQRAEWVTWLPTADFNPYVSPPFMALVYAPLAALPYGFALLAWTAITVALVVISLWLLWPLVPNLHRFGKGALLVQVFCAPPALYLLLGGQDTAVSLAVLVGGLRLFRAGRPMSAGALLGIGVMKPQLIVVIPIFLLAQRRWRALAGWVGVAGFLTALSIVMVGAQGVRDYMALPKSDFYRLAVVDGKGWEMQSFVTMARALLPKSAAGVVTPLTVTVAVAALAVLVYAVHRAKDEDDRFVRLYALAILTIPFVSPHLFLYDCLVLVIPVLILIDSGVAMNRVRWALIAAYPLLWTTPYRHFAVEQATWPLTALEAPWALVMMLVLYRALYQLAQGQPRPVLPCTATTA
jgi:hypothetical protein